MHRKSRLRRILLSVVIVVVMALVAVSILAIGIVRKPFPQTTGELAIEGLTAKVEVVRDARGVPTIYADTAADLFRAQGFVAASDRFFQMDLGRHVTAGRLAELVGDAGVSTDRIVRTLGWRRVAEQELPLLDSSTRQYLQAFADGVNAYLATRSAPDAISLEYTLLARQNPDYRIERWTPLDSLAWLKAMAWDLRSDYDDELARARLARSTTVKQVMALYPPYPVERNAPILDEVEWPSSGGGAPKAAAAVTRRSSGAVDLPFVAAGRSVDRTTAALAAIPPLIGRGDGIGSNSWVVSGKHTVSGKPILANDPHLGLAIPSTFSQVSLQCRTVSAQCPFRVSGFSLPATPGVVIGHNDRVAWGFTNLYADVTDFYFEQVKNETYLRDGKYVPLETRAETINIAGGSPVTFTVRSTVHGPIVSDEIPAANEAGDQSVVRGAPQTGQFAVSLAWTALTPSHTADSVFLLNRAQNWDQFRSAASKFAVPAQNMVYADVDGHIGYQTPGLIPVRASATPGTPPGYWPSPGWDSAWDWKGMVPFEQLPHVADPADGIIVAANQEVTSSARPFISSEWDYGFRAQRIRTLLQEKIATGAKLDAAAMTQIQADTRNTYARELTETLLNVEVDDFTRQAQAFLSGWSGDQPGAKGRDAASAAYYNAVWKQLLAGTFDELPADLQANGGGRWMVVMENLLRDPKNDWWDDKRTSGVTEGAGEILHDALVQARLDLARKLGKVPATWRWGRLHQLTLKHPVMSAESLPSPVRWLFTVDGIEVGGGSSIVNANSWDASADTFAVTNGPVFRMVVDLGDLDASTWVSSTGQSGQARHAHWADQVQNWVDVEPFPWPFTETAVRAAAGDTLTLTPKGVPAS